MFRYLLVILGVCLAAPALAETPSYNFLQAGYEWADIDTEFSSSIDADGFGLGGSFEIGDSFFVFASYATIELDVEIGSAPEFNTLQAGFGYRYGLNDNSDFFATASFVDAEIKEELEPTLDESGYGVSVGVRSNVSELIELVGEVAYVDLGDGADSTSIGGGIWFNVTDKFAIGLNASNDDDVTSYGGSLRLYFGD